jgi:outer membrane protein assembly factor BamB
MSNHPAVPLLRCYLAFSLVAGSLASPNPAGGASGPAAPPTAELFAAARSGDVDRIRKLLDSGTPVDTEDRYGQTALAFAAGAGSEPIVRLLLERGADPNRSESFYGTDPLERALDGGHFRVAVLLVAAGAADRERALEAALRNGDAELARAAIESGPIFASELARWSAAESLDAELARLLATAVERADPPPPERTIEQLHAFTGIFEGWTSDSRVEVVLREATLFAAIDGGRFEKLAPGRGQLFAIPGAELRLAFFGRAGTTEGLELAGGGRKPESLRRSVAEPVLEARPVKQAPSPQAAEAQVTVNWPSFRGANAAGIGDGADVPSTFDVETGESILWQVPVPGLGNSSPVVWGERLFVTTAVASQPVAGIRTGLSGAGDGHRDAVEHSWRVMALDKRTGETLWDTEIVRAVPASGRHFKATQANSSPATDGRHLVVVFPTAGIACLDLDGHVLWRHALGSLAAGAFTDPSLEWGFASSPILYGNRVILQVDTHEEQYLAAWELDTGDLAWKTERQVAPSWATPTVVSGSERDELVVNGSTIHGYDPATGQELWSLGPNSELVIATPVAGDGVAYVASGYPPVKPIYAVPLGLRGEHEVEPGSESDELLWSQRLGGAYMPTPLLYRGLYYVVHHNGRIVAYDPATGSALYKERFSRGGAFTGSPVAANGKLYVPTEEGLLYVLSSGEQYRELAINEVGEPLMATPAISEGILVLRTPTRLIAVASG